MPEEVKESSVKRMACKAPIPLAGLMLGLASAGNMVPEVRPLFGLLSAMVLAVLLLKLTLDSKTCREEFKNPAVVGILCTIPMGVSILTTYTKPVLPNISFAIWIAMLVIHFGIMVYFTKAFMFKLDIKKVLPSYFIVYVGITVGSVVAPTYGAYEIGQALFWFGFISYLVLLPLIFYRAAVLRSVPEPLVPTIAIFAAPASLCLAGYLKSFESETMWVVAVLFVLSIVSYVAVILYMPKMLRLKFYPSCSAFTFPLVISAIATNATYSWLQTQGIDIPVIQYLAYLEIILALLLITFVLVRYMGHFFVKKDPRPA
ncbi:MAG: potassium-tellurite ethidium and proflavin transporter [Methanomassiliicoccales archaeon PtaU1.Bin124]|nr:MAG: potassium-tellurite ethidium and proflavin transporter [Methanomassiliicoccales archaeon PtaU1.Bin124]